MLNRFDVFIFTALYRPCLGEMSRSDRGVILSHRKMLVFMLAIKVKKCTKQLDF